MNRIIRIAVGVAVLSIWIVGYAHAATTRYIDSACSNGITTYNHLASAGSRCTGGTDTSYTSLANAFTAATTVAGDTLYIREGTYAQKIDSNANTLPVGTSWNAPVTIAGYPGETVILNPGGNSIIGLVHSYIQYMIFDNLHLNGVNMTRNSDFDSENAVTIGYGCVACGFGGQTVSHIRIQNTEIYNSPWNGLTTAEGSDLHLINLSVHDNGAWTQTIGYPPGANGAYTSMANSEILGGEYYNNVAFGIRIFGPYNKGTGHDNVIRGVISRNNGGGIVIGDARNLVEHNVIHGNTGIYSIEVIENGSGKTTDNKFYNNTIYNNGGNVAILAGSVNTQFKNNHVIASGNVNDAGTTSSISDNRTAIGSITDCTVSTSDFSQNPGSVCIDAGVNVGRPFNGAAPDIGAFESIPTPTTAIASGNVVDVTLPMSLNTPVTPATGLLGWVVKFNGTPRGTVSAGKLTPTDTTVRIQYDGAACTGTSDNITVDHTQNNTSDSALIGGTLNQKLFSFTGLAVNESACGGGGSSPPAPHIHYGLNDGSGTTASDDSGNSLHGTVSSSPAPTWTTGTKDGALDFADLVNDELAVPYGSGVNPTSTSVTICIFVAPDSTSNERWFAGTPLGSNQRAYFGISGGTWAQGVRQSGGSPNNDFPVSAGYSLVCQEFNADTDTATLIVNTVRGTSTNGTGASVKSYASYTWSGNWVIGRINGFSGSSPGGVVDEVFIYKSDTVHPALSVSEMADLYDSLINPSPPGTGNRKQNGHQFQRPFKKASAPEDLRGPNGEAKVMRGGDVDVIFQIDCTGADCSDFGPRLRRSIDGGATYAQINDTCGIICFRGSANNPDLVTEQVEECLSGALTDVPGPTNVTSAAVPNVALSENQCTVIRYKLRTGYSEATPGQEIYLKLFDQNGNEFEEAYVPSLGAKLTIKEVGNGGGF